MLLSPDKLPNKFKPIMQRRQKAQRAYCPNIYTVLLGLGSVDRCCHRYNWWLSCNTCRTLWVEINFWGDFFAPEFPNLKVKELQLFKNNLSSSLLTSYCQLTSLFQWGGSILKLWCQLTIRHQTAWKKFLWPSQNISTLYRMSVWWKSKWMK